jgi:hypothetical protein
LDEAVASYRKALGIEPNSAKLFYNLGIAFKQQDKPDEEVASYRKALTIEPDYVRAHSNLGVALQKQGKLDEAINCFHRAIAIDDNYANAHKALGITLHYQSRLTEAKHAYRAGIALNPDPDIAHVGLRRVLIDLKELPVPACERPAERIENETSPRGLHIWNRPVENTLRETLYRQAVMSPEEEANSDMIKVKLSVGVRQGNMCFSTDFKLLESGNPIIEKLKDDLVESLSSLLGADIFIVDFFFNIYLACSKAVRHNHIDDDMDNKLGFAAQKFSLVYYIDPGDKTAEEPGILKLYDPDFSIYPEAGDIVLFPSGTDHSASYSGAADRVVLGVNFYTI